jgi:tetratricopeptide (TPR) repeat protein
VERKVVNKERLIERLDTAFAKRRAGDCSAALADFEDLEAVSQNPQDIATLRLFEAMCLTDIGTFDLALDRMAKVDVSALEIVDRIDYELEYARIDRALGRPTDALNRVTGAVKLIGMVEDTHRVEDTKRKLQAFCGVLLAEAGRCDEAIPVLKRVPLEDTWWVEARLHEGDCLYKKKLYKEAAECYLSVATAAKEVHQVHREAALRNTGFAFFDLGQYAKAVEYLMQVERAYDEVPTMQAEVFGILAAAHSRLGNSREAQKYRALSNGSGSVQ